MPDDDARTPPSRPQLSNVTPPPVRRLAPHPGSINASRSLWFVTFAIGMAALIFGFLWAEVQIGRLQEVVTDLDLDLDASVRERITAIAYFSSLGLLAITTALEMLFFNRMMSQRGGFRWALVATLLLHAFAAVIATAVVALGEQGVLIAALLVSQAVLAGAALLLSFLPSANRWFALRKQAKSAAFA